MRERRPVNAKRMKETMFITRRYKLYSLVVITLINNNLFKFFIKFTKKYLRFSKDAPKISRV